MEFSNPLQIPIDVSSVCLTCEFDDSSVNKPGKTFHLGFYAIARPKYFQANKLAAALWVPIPLISRLNIFVNYFDYL